MTTNNDLDILQESYGETSSEETTPIEMSLSELDMAAGGAVINAFG